MSLSLPVWKHPLSFAKTSCCFFLINKVVSTRALIPMPASDPSGQVPCQVVFEKFHPVMFLLLEDVVGLVKLSGSPCDAAPLNFFLGGVLLFREINPCHSEQQLVLRCCPRKFQIRSCVTASFIPSLDHIVCSFQAYLQADIYL